MDKKKTKRIMNKNLPEGAISIDTINKINEIYIKNALEEEGASDLVNILEPFSMGKVLEFAGQMKKAKETFQNILKKDPKNRWAKAALKQVERALN